MSVKSRLASVLSAVFGRFSWEAPSWGRRVSARVKAHARLLWGVLALVAISGGAYRWYVTRPPPPDQVLLTATVSNIDAPPRREKGEVVPPPAMVSVVFDGSAAPLEALHKPVIAQIALKPKVEGEWRWEDERTLVFAPNSPWPIGAHYTISLSPQLVSRPNLVLVTRELSFTTEAFSARIENVEFYQDPVDPRVKQVVGTVRFSYPVDPASFEKRVTLVSAPSSNQQQTTPLKFTVSYDALRFEAYVRSDSLPVPLEDHRATLTLDKGTTAEGSSVGAQERLSQAITIPGKGSRFHVNVVTPVVARNAEGDSEQVLIFRCTSPVNEKVFASGVKVWVLPPKAPYTASEISPDVLKRSTRLSLTPVPGEREVSEVQNFKFDAAPGSRLFIRVEAGIEAVGGYVLSRPHEAQLTVPEYPRELKLAHEGSVLSITGDKKLSVTARGLPAFRVRLFRIQPKDVNHLLTQAMGSFAHLSMQHGLFNEENISEVFSEVHPLDASNPRSTQYAAIDFAPYLKESGEQHGLYFARVEGWNPTTQQVITQDSRSDEAPRPAHDEPDVEAVDRSGDEGSDDEGPNDGNENDGSQEQNESLSDQRFIMITDLGVIDKVDTEGNHWVYAQSFRTGAPVGGAQIEVLAKNGTVVLRKTTDSSGAATLPPFKDLTAEKTPVALVVRRERDVSLLPLNRSDRSLDFSRFDVGGVRTNGRAAALSAYVFSDRGLYRPQETVHLAAVVRAVDWSKSVKGTPLRLVITDPQGHTVGKHNATLDEMGLTSIDFTPEENAPTGTYTLTVGVPVGAPTQTREVQLGSTSFRVEEFLPDSLRLSTHFVGPTQGWVTGAKLKALLELRSLFGTPAADHRVTASVDLTPYSPSFSQYPDYQFFDSARASRSETMSLSEKTTDAEGNAEYEVDLSRWAPATWAVSLYVEGFELGGGRSVSSVATVIASPREFLLGFKADGDLSFIKRASNRSVQLIAIDPTLKKKKVDALTLTLVEKRFVSVLAQESNGSYRYQSVLKEVTRKTVPLSVSESGTTLSVPNDEVGAFFWSVRDAEGVELSRVPFTVVGEANVAKELEKNAELQVSLDKTEYAPGDTMTVQITAPYAGAGILTIERDKVWVHKAFKTTTSTTVQTIEVPAGLDVNGYLNVSFVRAIDSPELYVSPLSYGVVPFSIVKKSQQLQVTLKTPELSKPGQPMTITYQTDQPSKIVVFAVDEGILQVARHQTPDPLGFFLEKRALEVKTRQIVDLLLPEFRLVRGGGQEGGDADGVLARNLNPFKRKTDVPAVYWSGLLDAGPQEKSVTFTVPESFNGSLRVMAVAVAPGAMAAVKHSTLIRGPFVINPNTPTFVSPGDTFVVTAAIANNVEGSGEHAELTVTMRPSAAFALAPGVKATQTLKVAQRREGVVSFDVKATDVLGDGELQFQVSGARQEATRTAHVSVRPLSAYWVATQSGSVKDSSVTLSTKRIMFDQFATRQLVVSFLPLGLASGLVDYLESYPHLCSEQLTSRAVPALVLMHRPEWGYEATKSKAAFERAFSVLRARQNDQGEFGYWAANSFTMPTLDVFIALMLTEAKERGVASPGDVRVKVLESLKRSQLPVSDLSQARLRAQALYVLARNGVVAPAQTAQLAEFLGRQSGPASEVAFAYLAATYSLTNNPKRAEELMNQFSLSDDVTPDEARFFDNTVYRAQVLYLFAKHFPQKLESVGPKVLTLLVKSMTAGLHSLGASWSLFALDAYSTVMQGSLSGGLKSVTIETQEANGSWKTRDAASGLTAKVAFPAQTTGFKVTAADGALIFYSLTESGFDKTLPSTSIAEGIEVIHTLEDDQGHAVSKVKLGDEINVHLRTRSLSRASFGNIALVDLLPSGFEVVMNRGPDLQGIARLATAGATLTWHPDELDVREDRVVLYGTVANSMSELRYRIKAVAKGTFVVPPAQATGMYRPDLRARSLGGSLVVE